MKKIISTIFLVGGLILLYFGYQEYQSFASEVKEAFTGSPSSEAMWMMIGGAAAAIAGLTGLLRK
jgi:hypothetical protein